MQFFINLLMEVNDIFLNKYKIESVLGSGGFGKVYKATNIKTNKQVALKTDIKTRGVVISESRLLRKLQSIEGIPKVYESGKADKTTYMVFELLGLSLGNAMKKNGGKLPAIASVLAGLQLLTRLEHIHGFGVVHRDIKPHNCLFDLNCEVIYLIDFGLAKEFMIGQLHQSEQSGCSCVGNSSFASLGNHMGFRQSRRDDLESLGYLMIYLIKGRLPWQKSAHKKCMGKWQKVFTIKAAVPVHELCIGCPGEFMEFLNYARSLKFDEKPKYDYLRNLLEKVKRSLDYSEYSFLWLKDFSSALDSSPRIRGRSNYRRDSIKTKSRKAKRSSTNTDWNFEEDREITENCKRSSKKNKHRRSKAHAEKNTIIEVDPLPKLVTSISVMLPDTSVDNDIFDKSFPDQDSSFDIDIHNKSSPEEDYSSQLTERNEPPEIINRSIITKHKNPPSEVTNERHLKGKNCCII
ncbi:unnamed protein product [Blepharisma stoltei]|uniref:Casein kinase I n=1 Tax=Blepharisma stoltei TaxID=1481888 RepID=A0AAU9IKQ3_9CILI|nr:unnamed protein product [Blepharisma stoltei]